ncbi:MAG TPA: PrsW family intramembrane metalloprotease [Pyrinomonadaceae bacterium]|nr:PrsW family intramembrane metalloprotease [Pyrinomonadaceae bacterium]
MTTPQNYHPSRDALPKTTHTSAIKVVLAFAAILIATFLGLIVLALIGFETGLVGLLIGFVAATIPVPLYVLLVLWIDRYEAEPLWMLASAFFWGALVAVFIAVLFNTASSLIVASVTDSMQAGEVFGAVISAPIVEETAKAFILFIFFFWKKDEFDGVIDGIMYAAMVGLGFAMTENIQYYGRAVLSGSTVPVFILRGMFAPFSHPLFTSMTGIGLGLARQSSSTFVKLLLPIVGLLSAIFMHSIWNGSAALFGGLGFIVTYVVIMVPAFAIMLVIIFLALRREGRLVGEFLRPDFERGVLSQQEYQQLCSIRGRMSASYTAFSQGGMTHWRMCRQFNQTASELAFHRSRVARGITSGDENAREEAYRSALQHLSAQLRQQRPS